MNYLVLGAAGSIGQRVTRALLAANHSVIASVRRSCPEAMVDVLVNYGAVVMYVEDAADRGQMERLAEVITEYQSQKLDGVIYCVGHCPPGGLTDAMSVPLFEMPLERYADEVRMHQIGVINTYQCLLGTLKAGGCLLFLSSAITRLAEFPPFLHVHYHASVVAAEDWLVAGMRHDPATAERGVLVHRIAPAAVDTPFHEGAAHLPPDTVSTGTVVDAIVQALTSEEHVDRQLL